MRTNTRKFRPIVTSLILSLTLVMAIVIVTPVMADDSSLELIYSTYLGGSGNDWGKRLSVTGTSTGISCAFKLSSFIIDFGGNAYVTGKTNSPDFPVKDANQDTLGGRYDAFVAKFSPLGNLIWSTYLGDTEEDASQSIAIGPEGNIHITGYTWSSNFPTTADAYDPDYNGDEDVFVAKFSPSGQLLYSTFLGGSDCDSGNGIAVDSEGSVYITGKTGSTDDFPTKNAYQGANAGWWDAFVTKFSSSGVLLYSTFLGGSDDDIAYDVAVDSSGNAYVTGYTYSYQDFPLKNACQGTFGGGDYDAIAAKIDTRKSGADSLVYSTYLGGADNEYGNGVAVDDSSGNALVAGWTGSSDFITTTGAYQETYGGGDSDAYITKLSSLGNCLCSTFVGGTDYDGAGNITIGPSGNIYIAGSTSSDDFPIKDAYQDERAGESDVFITKLSPILDADSLMYSTYLGGSDADYAYGIATNKAGCAYVTGWTNSLDFPTEDPAQSEYGGGKWDAFVTKLCLRVPVTSAVGGEVQPINKTGVLTPWLGLAVILAIGGGALFLRRQRAH